MQYNANGIIYQTECIFNPPVSLEEIESYASQNGWLFPEQYKQFLQFSNGAFLFKDQYGSGVEFFSLSKIAECHFDFIPDHWIPIAYYIGDFFLIDSSKVKENKGYLLFQNHEQGFETPTIRFNIDFATWIERLIITRANAFWNWNN
ncbi:hypothetical protein PAECIP111892_01053 [Paenibacillus auburnensis]|uniref:Knr4/Smi1-like domain-containing protein n=1 Tax=Paenibacillus auburnensis TaxID=2905649 RepID=A0ABM9BQT1_9BACL|nr:hypothetical protein PAECIP111892_01053 [Paenibacillus auburnensis]